MSYTINESVTDMTIRLVEKFRKNATPKAREEVVQDIVCLNSEKAALVAARVYQSLDSDSVLTKTYCRLFEAQVNKKIKYSVPPTLEMQAVKVPLYLHKGKYLGHNYVVGYNCHADRYWYELDNIVRSESIHYSRLIAEEMLKLEIDISTNVGAI